MNKIISHLENDKLCRGFSILSTDGIIQESSQTFDENLAYSIYKIFSKYYSSLAMKCVARVSGSR